MEHCAVSAMSALLDMLGVHVLSAVQEGCACLGQVVNSGLGHSDLRTALMLRLYSNQLVKFQKRFSIALLFRFLDSIASRCNQQVEHHLPLRRAVSRRSSSELPREDVQEKYEPLASPTISD